MTCRTNGKAGILNIKIKTTENDRDWKRLKMNYRERGEKQRTQKHYTFSPRFIGVPLIVMSKLTTKGEIEI